MNNISPNLIPAHDTLTFRLCIDIKFNKLVEDNDSTSIGSFTFEFNGLPVQFDFEEVNGGRLITDHSIVRFELRNPDYSTFANSMVLTKEMLKNVTGIIEIVSDTEEGNFEESEDNNDDVLHPVEVVDATFIILNRFDKGDPYEEIPIPILTGWKFQD